MCFLCMYELGKKTYALFVNSAGMTSVTYAACGLPPPLVINHKTLRPEHKHIADVLKI